MKRVFKLAGLLSAAVFMFAGCAEDDGGSSIKKIEENIPKSIKITKTLDAEDEGYELYEFDEHGYETKYASYSSVTDTAPSSITVFVNDYDEDGKLTKVSKYNSETISDENLRYYIKYAYDKAGNNISKKNYDSDGSVGDYVLYQYNSDGLVTRETNSSFGRVYTYEYDSNGFMIKETYDDLTENSSDYYSVYKNDSNGKLLSFKKYDMDDNLKSTGTCEPANNGRRTTIHDEINDCDTYSYVYIGYNKPAFEYYFTNWTYNDTHTFKVNEKGDISETTMVYTYTNDDDVETEIITKWTIDYTYYE